MSTGQCCCVCASADGEGVFWDTPQQKYITQQNTLTCISVHVHSHLVAVLAVDCHTASTNVIKCMTIGRKDE